MAQYILRDLPEELWTGVKNRAEREGWPLRPLILQLLGDYVQGHITPAGSPPMVAEYGWLRPLYRDLVQIWPAAVSAPDLQVWPRLNQLVADKWGQAKASPLNMNNPPRRSAILNFLKAELVEQPGPADRGNPKGGISRRVVIKFDDGSVVRLPGAQKVTEQDHDLVFSNDQGQLLGRLDQNTIKTWYFEDFEGA